MFPHTRVCPKVVQTLEKIVRRGERVALSKLETQILGVEARVAYPMCNGRSPVQVDDVHLIVTTASNSRLVM